MTKEELKEYRREIPPQAGILAKILVEDKREDVYGVYSTGFFHYKGKNIFINVEDGRWHLSVSSDHTLGYYELKDIRYRFMPNDMSVAQIFPPWSSTILRAMERPMPLPPVVDLLLVSAR